MAFSEDLSAFFNTETPGYAVVTIGGAQVGGIFDNGSASALNAMLGTNPIFTCKTADAGSDPRSKELVNDGVTYTVREAKPDGTGITVMELEAA